MIAARHANLPFPPRTARGSGPGVLLLAFACTGTLIAVSGCAGGNQESLRPLPAHVLGFDEPSIAVTGPGMPVAVGEEILEWSHTGYRPWKYIVIHHSSTEGGNAASFDRDHRDRGFDELGYHFVITNANGGKDGQIEVSRRWRTQKWGAHTGRTEGNRYNNYGIGICLVGNFDLTDPSAKQLAALNALVRYLVIRYGIRADDVITHRDAPGASTVCPGRNLYRYVHTTLRPELRRLGK